MHVQTLQELIYWQPPKVTEIVGSGILHESCVLFLFGGPKTFKSIAAQQLALCMAYGENWFGFPTAPISTLLIQAEIPKTMFRHRILKMASRFKHPMIAPVYFATERNMKLDTDSGIKHLNATLIKHNPQVVIIDPWYKFLANRDEPGIVKAINNIDASVERYHYCPVVIHHSRKTLLDPGGTILDMGGQDMWGSRWLEAWPDSILHIQGDPRNDNRSMEFELRNAENLLSPFNFTLDRSKLWLHRT